MNGSQGFKWSVLLGLMVMLGAGNVLASQKEQEPPVEKTEKVTVNQNAFVRMLASLISGIKALDRKTVNVNNFARKSWNKLIGVLRWVRSKLPGGKKLSEVIKEKKDDSAKNMADAKKLEEDKPEEGDSLNNVNVNADKTEEVDNSDFKQKPEEDAPDKGVGLSGQGA